MARIALQRKLPRPDGAMINLDNAARSLQGILCWRDAQHACIVPVRKGPNDAAGKVPEMQG